MCKNTKCVIWAIGKKQWMIMKSVRTFKILYAKISTEDRISINVQRIDNGFLINANQCDGNDKICLILICYKIIEFHFFTVTAKLERISFVYMRNLQWSLLPLDEACQMIYIPVDTLWLPHMLLRRITSK